MEKIFETVDGSVLIRKKNSIKKELSEKKDLIKKRVAVLGGSTTNEVVEQLELFLLYYGIQCEFYQSDYGRYWEDGMYGNEILDAFQPDIIYIYTNWRNIRCFPSLRDGRERIDRMLQDTYMGFERLWDCIEQRFHCPIIQNNFDRPLYRIMGNKDISDIHGKTNFIYRLNGLIYEYAQTHNHFYVNDIDYLAAKVGLEKWYNPTYWHMYKYAVSLDAIPFLAKSVADIIKSIYGKNKKAIVLDLDNTLWGGTIGDDGVEGIAIGPELPSGQIYTEIQNYFKEYKELGILLAINSKNDEENAIAGLNHPDGILRPDDFVTIKANWNNKDKNIIEIAHELNLGADSFVFVDDNPVERDLVSHSNLGVAVPDIGSAEHYIEYLDQCGYFEVTTYSEDDRERNVMYKANIERDKLKFTMDNPDEFLISLEMKCSIRPFEPIYFQRIAQLTNKSNQFNLTTLRCSEADILNMSKDNNYMCLYGKLRDKFGDNGIVTVVIGRKQSDKLELVLWLMSCRVLQRGMEDAMMDVVMDYAKQNEIGQIVGHYYPTSKNHMVCDFYERMGFRLVEETTDGDKHYICDVDKYSKRNDIIELI